MVEHCCCYCCRVSRPIFQGKYQQQSVVVADPLLSDACRKQSRVQGILLPRWSAESLALLSRSNSCRKLTTNLLNCSSQFTVQVRDSWTFFQRLFSFLEFLRIGDKLLACFSDIHITLELYLADVFLPMCVARLCYQTKLSSATAATTRTTNRKVSSLRASLAARKRNSRENSEMPPQVRKERPRVVQWNGGKERDRLRRERKRRLHRYRTQLLCYCSSRCSRPFLVQ